MALMPLLLTVVTPATQKIGYAAPTPPGIGGALLGLLLVLGLILGLAWLLKRLPGHRLGLRLPTDNPLRVITRLSVGHKHQVVLIQIGDEQLLLGISPSGIAHLHRLPQPLPPSPSAPPALGSWLATYLRQET